MAQASNASGPRLPAEAHELSVPIPKEGIGTDSTASKSSASVTSGGPSKASTDSSPKKDANSPTELAHPKLTPQANTSAQGDPVAKFVGDAAGAAAKKAFGF